MPNPMDAAVAAMFGALTTVGASDVAVRRDGVLGWVSAVPEEVREHSLNFLARDFICRKSALIGFGLPKPGDVWTYAGQSYEVRPFENEVGYAWLDNEHEQLLVHTKDIAWQRDSLRFSQMKQKPGAGQAKQEVAAEFRVKGLLKVVGGSEQYDGRQRVALRSAIAILPALSSSKALDPYDSFSIERDGQCRNFSIESIRDPGTNGSVLYIECNERV